MDIAVLRKVFRDAFRIDRVDYPKVDLLTVAHDTDRSYLFQGKYYSPLIDTIEDDIRGVGLKCTSVARIFSSVKGDRAYGDVRSPEGAFARALLQKRLIGLFARSNYPYSDAEEQVWRNILAQTGASSVIAIQPSRELCKACHDKGVWVADMQHGVIAEQHPWYGKDFRSKDPIEQLPDAFLCWDQGSANVIRQWADGSIETPIIGNPWLLRFMRNAPLDPVVNSLHSALNTGEQDKRPKVLVTLSWGDDGLPESFIAKELEAAIRQTSAHINWLIRLHPNQLTGYAKEEQPKFLKYFDQALRGHAEWEWATRTPLPYLLTTVDAHISWNSSVSIEAALVGLKTGLLDPRLQPGQDMDGYFSYFRSTNDVELIPLNEKAIIDWIDITTKRGRNEGQLSENEDAYANLLRTIAQLSGYRKI